MKISYSPGPVGRDASSVEKWTRRFVTGEPGRESQVIKLIGGKSC